MSQLRIPAVHVRGGTSKFNAGNPMIFVDAASLALAGNELQSEVTR